MLRRPEGIGRTLRPDLGNASGGKRERGAVITAAAAPYGAAAALFGGGVRRAYPDRPILAVGAVAVKDGKVLRGDPSPSEELEDARWVEIADLSRYRMTRGTPDLIRRPIARQENGLQCHGGQGRSRPEWN